MHKSLSYILFLLLICFLVSCYEKKEGCIDIYATNFTPEADQNCCCQYPKLQLNFTHQLDSMKAFSGTEIVKNALGQQFKISNFTYYLSEFVLTDANGNEYITNDTFHLPVIGNFLVLKDDIALIRPSTTSVTLGSFKQLDAFKSLKFQFGPPEEANSAQILLIPDKRTLSTQAETLFLAGTGYASIKVIYTDGTDAAAQEKTIYIYDKVPIELNVDVPAKIGSNTCISITTNYAYWVRDVDVILDDEATVRSKILNNLKGSMLIKSCE